MVSIHAHLALLYVVLFECHLTMNSSVKFYELHHSLSYHKKTLTFSKPTLEHRYAVDMSDDRIPMFLKSAAHVVQWHDQVKQTVEAIREKAEKAARDDDPDDPTNEPTARWPKGLLQMLFQRFSTSFSPHEMSFEHGETRECNLTEECPIVSRSYQSGCSLRIEGRHGN